MNVRNMKKLKKSLAITMLTSVLVASTVLGSPYSVHAKEKNDLVPLRSVAEALGAKVSWDQQKQEITVERGSNVIVLTAGQEQAIVNGINHKLDEKPIVQSNRSYISLHTINKLLSNQVEWDEETESILFSNQNYEINATQFVHKLFSGNASDITTIMSQALKNTIPQDAMWSSIGQQYALLAGKPVMLKDLSMEYNDVHINAVMSYETTNAPLNIIVRFDQDGYVDDLSIDIAASVSPYTKPDYDTGNYIEEEVVIGEGTFAVPGTFTVPKGEGPFPVVILVHGSGPHDRDSTISGTKVFKDLAVGLASRNIAVLRYEKVTKEHTFKVSGQPQFTLKNESVDDVYHAMEWLQQRGEVDKDKLYVAGHSQGGFVMPKIIEQDKGNDISGAILISAPSSTFIDALVEQQKVVIDKMKTLGLPQEVVSSQEQNAVMMEQIKAMLLDPAYSKDNMPGTFPMSPAYWWYEQRDYVPAEVMKDMNKPLLVLQGENDWQVSMEQFEGWKTALEDHSDTTFISYPAMNHLLTDYEGVSIGLEYSTPANVSKKLITDIADWILNR